MRINGQERRRYHFSDALRADLILAYAGKKTHVSRKLDELQRRTGWPRWAFKYEAQRLGIITADHRRQWTAGEQEYLEEALGLVSIKRIARKLGRTVQSVTSRAEKLGLSRRAKDGYNMTDLAAVFGESTHKIRRWMDRGLLGQVRDQDGCRVKTDDVKRFVLLHYGEYDLRRVDQHWFKTMIFEDGHGAERWL